MTADQWHCGQTLVLAKEVDTYRVIVPKPSPDGHNCPLASASFNCSIHFKLHRSDLSYDNRQICVDFARMRLNGDLTKLSIGTTRVQYNVSRSDSVSLGEFTTFIHICPTLQISLLNFSEFC